MGNNPQIDPDNEVIIIEVDPHLNEEILECLGDDPAANETPKAEIHKDLASRWGHLLKSGLTKVKREQLLQKYPTPLNCSPLRAPKLHDEVKRILNASVIRKDTFQEQVQDQLGKGLTALGLALNKILAEEKQAYLC